MANVLYYGDNLDVLRQHIGDETVDLVYLDPPFNSNATYNVLFSEQDGERAAAQIQAFSDTWRWDQAAVFDYEHVIEQGGDVADAMRAFRTFLGESNLLAYLAMMAPRLVELRRVLKPTGSIYLHCDPTASHYLKMLMDAVFGPQLFLNEIVWCYDTGGRSTTSFPRKHDTILRYGRTKDTQFFYDQVALQRDFSTMHEKIHTDDDGRQYQTNVKAGKEYRYYLDKGVLPNDWWADIQAINPSAKERLGYPTQKPAALLERIIAASSRPGDVVLDPFCGCGTTIAAAEGSGRTWFGIDITHLAVNLIKYRLQDTYGEAVNDTYKVVGEPASADDAVALAAEDPYQFQFWSLGLVGARPVEEKKGADRGIDGRLYFHDEPAGGDTKQVIFSVKAGKVSVPYVRDLRGVIEREDAQIGVLISLNEPTQPMKTEAASAGLYRSPWGEHPRIQLFTVEQLLNGARIDMPPAGAQHRIAPRDRRKERGDQMALEVGLADLEALGPIFDDSDD